MMTSTMRGEDGEEEEEGDEAKENMVMYQNS